MEKRWEKEKNAQKGNENSLKQVQNAVINIM